MHPHSTLRYLSPACLQHPSSFTLTYLSCLPHAVLSYRHCSPIFPARSLYLTVALIPTPLFLFLLFPTTPPRPPPLSIPLLCLTASAPAVAEAHILALTLSCSLLSPPSCFHTTPQHCGYYPCLFPLSPLLLHPPLFSPSFPSFLTASSLFFQLFLFFCIVPFSLTAFHLLLCLFLSSSSLFYCLPSSLPPSPLLLHLPSLLPQPLNPTCALASTPTASIFPPNILNL